MNLEAIVAQKLWFSEVCEAALCLLSGVAFSHKGMVCGQDPTFLPVSCSLAPITTVLASLHPIQEEVGKFALFNYYLFASYP